MPSPQDEEFFVGYLPTPPRLKRFLLAGGVAIVLLALTTAQIIASRQRDPGNGTWSTDQRAFTGTLTLQSYPMLHLSDGTGTLLLVGEGKHAAAIAEDRPERQIVRATGTVIARANVRILELDAPLKSNGETANPPRLISAASPQTFRGEIIDPKCFCGAMKPGEGKTHKGCAALCLRGGIPPALRSPAGDFLLVDEGGNAINGDALEPLIALVGEPVELLGTPAVIGQLHVLKIDPTRIHRL
jgi:hypothetical protein